MTGSFVDRGNQYIQLVKVLYCKLPKNGKQLPAFQLEVGPGTKPRSQRWEARVLQFCHLGPLYLVEMVIPVLQYILYCLGLISQRDLSPDLDLNLRLWS